MFSPKSGKNGCQVENQPHFKKITGALFIFNCLMYSEGAIKRRALRTAYYTTRPLMIWDKTGANHEVDF